MERRLTARMAEPGISKVLFVVLLGALALSPAAGRRKNPPAPLPAVVQALKPTGLRISVLDTGVMDLVIINANINTPLEEKEQGKITQTILRAQDGFWTMEDTSQQLKPNDIVFYWIYSSESEGRRNYVGYHLIADLVDPSCKPTVTTINGQPACKGALIFEDNFDTFNKTSWKHKIEFPAELFNAFVPDEENTFTKDGVLHLKATAITDPIQLSEPWKLEGCTSEKGGDFCERKPFAWQIVPPTKAPWLISTFSYKFGRLEVRAKVAAGDYLLSKLWLTPLVNEYGNGDFESGEMMALEIRGNEDLVDGAGDQYGAKMTRGQAGVASCWLVFLWYQVKRISEGLYSDTYHTYTVTWTTSEINFAVDGEVFRTVAPPQPDGFAGTNEYKDCDTNWEKGTFMSPFDREFILQLNLNVGGFKFFSDEGLNRNKKMPWKNWTPKAPVDFWRHRDEWLPTWKGDFEIDYIRIWAL